MCWELGVGVFGVGCGCVGSWVWVCSELDVGVLGVGCGCVRSWVWVCWELGVGVFHKAAVDLSLNWNLEIKFA